MEFLRGFFSSKFGYPYLFGRSSLAFKFFYFTISLSLSKEVLLELLGAIWTSKTTSFLDFMVLGEEMVGFNSFPKAAISGVNSFLMVISPL